MSHETTFTQEDHSRDESERIRVLRQALADGEASGDAGVLLFDEIRRAARARAEDGESP